MPKREITLKEEIFEKLDILHFTEIGPNISQSILVHGVSEN